MGTSGSHLQTQKCVQNTSSERTGGPDQRKEYIELRKTQEDEGTRGKAGALVRLHRGGGTDAGLIPTSGQLNESEEKRLRLRVKQLICGSLNGMRIRQSWPQPHTPRRGSRSWGIVERSQDERCCWPWRDGSRGGAGGGCGGEPAAAEARRSC